MIHHVQLACPVGCEAALREFYGGVLGMEEVPKPPTLAARGGAWFRLDDPTGVIELHFGVEEDFRPALKAHPGLLVSDLDAVASRLESAGYAVRWDDEFPGMRRFYSSDCNGNRLEFLSPKNARAMFRIFLVFPDSASMANAAGEVDSVAMTRCIQSVRSAISTAMLSTSATIAVLDSGS